MDINLLLQWGASPKKLEKGQFVFQEGEQAAYFYQLESGQVKMFNINKDGKEFTQGIFGPGDSFGEPPLFIDENYPASAMATTKTVLLRLSKDRFLKMLDENRPLEKAYLKILARRIHAKSVTASEVINNNPAHRIIAFLNDYKKRNGTPDVRIQIPYTRQEIANLTGLRVETVIRTLSVLKARKQVEIRDRKLYY